MICQVLPFQMWFHGSSFDYQSMRFGKEFGEILELPLLSEASESLIVFSARADHCPNQQHAI